MAAVTPYRTAKNPVDRTIARAIGMVADLEINID